ncbi:MAG: hypothetical protein QXV17_14750 [Candidatus Micrarchaeaceae archaeon]
MDTSFLNSWNDDVKKENDRKVGHLYEYPQEFFIFLSKVRELWNVLFRELEGFVKKLSDIVQAIELRRNIPAHKEYLISIINEINASFNKTVIIDSSD